VRTVYLGTSDFAATVLERLAGSAHRPTLVITRPDRPRGRGRRLSPPPVADTARALGLPLAQPEALGCTGSLEQIAGAEPEALALCAYGAMVQEPLLSAHPTFNVHPSLLPRWRGAAPIERAIMAGDAVTGVSIMRLAAELDAGPVCLAREEPISQGDTYGTLAPRLAGLGGELLVEALDTTPPFVAQDEDRVTYAEKITAGDRTLDPARPAVDVERVVRALTPHIGARVALADGSMLGVISAAVAAEAADDDAPPPGELRPDGGRLRLGCSPGALELRVVQPPGGRPMEAADFLRGRGLAAP
jgi:methionyl-tRNA formyltransferase